MEVLSLFKTDLNFEIERKK